VLRQEIWEAMRSTPRALARNRELQQGWGFWSKSLASENPPKLFVAGSDALAVITPAIEERLNATRAYQELSKSAEGSF
jgi:hypothetical protein